MVAVVGATASGKSSLALELAAAVGGEIVNTDSLQVYRHFDIGTAKPNAAERARVPHHLIDVAEPEQPYSAGRYVDDARAALAGIVARGRVPILCGGTGLYYRALTQGLADIPPVPPPVQAALEARIAERGSPAVHAELARVDAEAAAAIHPNDPVRIARALAVFVTSGRPLSEHRGAQPFRAGPAQLLAVGLHWERARLYERVNARVRAMLAAGWVAEVRVLLERGYGPAIKPMRAIGYREIAVWLLAGGEPDRDPGSDPAVGVPEALAEEIAQRTRRYAKRQLTWFRRHPEVQWAPPGQTGAIHEAVRRFVQRELPRARGV